VVWACGGMMPRLEVAVTMRDTDANKGLPLQTWRRLPQWSRDMLAPARIRSFAWYWGFIGFLLFGGMAGRRPLPFGLSLDHILQIAFLPPITLWVLSKALERYAPVDEVEARELISKLGVLLMSEPTSRLAAHSLPTSLRRMKKAFAVVVPVAQQHGDLEQLNALSIGYISLAMIGVPDKDQYAKSLPLMVEFDRLQGKETSIGEQADLLRTEARKTARFFSKEASENRMREIAASELRAKRNNPTDV
jgi:hypothetical protein